MTLTYQYDVVGEEDLQAIYWLSGDDEDWMADFGYIPSPENLIQKYKDGVFRIWSDDYPEDGYMELNPPHKVGDLVDGMVVNHIELHRDESLHNNVWLFKTTFKSV